MKHLLAAVAVATAAVLSQTGAAATPSDDADAPSLATYPKVIEELGHRKRVNVLFPNPQSIFDGYHIGFVNVSAGNLTFKRRDLVARVAGATVVFARIHDSRIKRNEDFGPGWRLSLVEELIPDGEALIYVDGSGARHRFASKDDANYRASPMKPSHARTRIAVGPQQAVVETADGTVSTFKPRDKSGAFVVSTVTRQGEERVVFAYRTDCSRQSM